MIKTIVFDWDGTLHNTKKLYGKSFRHAYKWLVSEGLAPEREYTDDDVTIYLGMNPYDMWNKFMPDLDADKKQHGAKLIGSRMDEIVSEGNAVLYDGVTETLDKLKEQGYSLVILSNCRHAYMEAHKKAFALERWFDGFYAAEDYNFIPKDEIFKKVMEEHKGDFVMVGDRKADIDTGVKNQVYTIGCTYGFGNAKELEEADILIDNITKLPDVLKKVKM